MPPPVTLPALPRRTRPARRSPTSERCTCGEPTGNISSGNLRRRWRHCAAPRRRRRWRRPGPGTPGSAANPCGSGWRRRAIPCASGCRHWGTRSGGRRSPRHRRHPWRRAESGVLFVLDNYDSFTYNLVQYFGELGAEPLVRRNDELTLADVFALEPDAIVISPGPRTPAEAGISVPLVREAARRGVPLLGVCLGHQAIGAAFGGRVVRAERLMHGKQGMVAHGGDGLFAGLPSPFPAMRYHSLVVAPEGLPGDLEITASSADRPAGAEIMGLRVRGQPVFGVQFHPEAVGTDHGRAILRDFLALAAGVGA